MSDKLIRLEGDINEKVKEALKIAKENNRHKTNIQLVEDMYSRAKIDMTDSARTFYEEYGGLFTDTYLMTNEEEYMDFQFKLWADYPELSLDAVNDLFRYKKENGKFTPVDEEEERSFGTNILPLGEIGYYYYGLVWIGEDGSLYVTHDYEDDQMRMFGSLEELMSFEIADNEFYGISISDPANDEEYDRKLHENINNSNLERLLRKNYGYFSSVDYLIMMIKGNDPITKYQGIYLSRWVRGTDEKKKLIKLIEKEVDNSVVPPDLDGVHFPMTIGDLAKELLEYFKDNGIN